MCKISRKYLRLSKKKIFIKNNTLFLSKNVLKKKQSAVGSKLSPHKNITTKKTKEMTLKLKNYKVLCKNSLYITTLHNIYNSMVNLYKTVNVTDLGIIFLTPGIFKKTSVMSNFSNFMSLANNLGMPIMSYKVGQIASNIQSSVNGYFASSSGTYCVVLQVQKNSIKFKLPSGGTLLKSNPYSYLGSNIVIPKLSNYRYKSTLLSVRGIAKNPVDHPNGGRSNTKGSFKTPWGKIAKFSK